MGNHQSPGRIAAMRYAAALVALAALVVVARGAPGEVQSLDEPGEGAVLLQEAENPKPSAEVVGLSEKIKNLQADISDIRSKKSAAASEARDEHDKAQQSEGTEQDKHMKKHIAAKAKLADLTAAEKAKSSQVVEHTMAQHDSARSSAIKHAGASNVDTSSTAGLNGHSSSSSSGGYGAGSFSGGYGMGGASQAGEIFDAWLTKWGAMRSKLSSMVSQEAAEVKTQHEAVNTQMEVAKKAYQKEYQGHMAAVAKAKEFNTKEGQAKAAEKKAKAAEQAVKQKMAESLHKAQERQSKAVEKKQKETDHQRKLKEEFERKVKAFHPGNCGPIKEKEQKAKAEIKRLQAENHQIRTNCEAKSKEMATKSQERLTKAQEQTQKQKDRADELARQLAAAKQKIQSLTAALSAAKAQIAHLTSELEKQKQETEKQRQLKEAALAKVKDLEAQLAAMTARFNKIKSTLDHINQVSGQPHRRK